MVHFTHPWIFGRILSQLATLQKKGGGGGGGDGERKMAVARPHTASGKLLINFCKDQHLLVFPWVGKKTAKDHL